MGSLSEALALSLPLAFAIAASPAAMIAMIILLMSRKAASNALYFLAGWYMGLMLVGIIFLHRPALYDASGEPSFLFGWIRLGLGFIILLAGIFMLNKALKKEKRNKDPKWARNVESFGFYQSVFLGFFFAAINLKNASMVTTGSATIGNVGLGGSLEIIVLILFCLVASIGVLVPPLIYFLFRAKAEVLYGKMKQWLIRYDDLIVFIICLVFGSLLLYQGVDILRS